jgi:coenzyme F420-reducing hydrogenase delta subunit
MIESKHDFEYQRLKKDVQTIKKQIQELFIECKRIGYLNNENVNSIQPTLKEHTKQIDNINFLLAEIENFNEEKKNNGRVQKMV